VWTECTECAWTEGTDCVWTEGKECVVTFSKFYSDIPGKRWSLTSNVTPKPQTGVTNLSAVPIHGPWLVYPLLVLLTLPGSGGA